jgi:hypothetical protein
VQHRSDTPFWRLNPRISVVALHDVTMAALAFELAVWLRYYTYGAPQSFGYLWEGTLLFAATSAVVFWATGLYRGIWYYASSRDLITIAKAVTLAMLVFLPLMFAMNRLATFPRTALLIEWPILVVLLAGPRLLYRLIKDGNLQAVLERGGDDRVPVLVVGAGDAADGFIREMSRSRLARYRVVGLIDDKPHRIGRDIRGVRVLGTIDALGEVVQKLDAQHRRPQRLILATDKLDGAGAPGAGDGRCARSAARPHAAADRFQAGRSGAGDRAGGGRRPAWPAAEGARSRRDGAVDRRPPRAGDWRRRYHRLGAQPADRRLRSGTPGAGRQQRVQPLPDRP